MLKKTIFAVATYVNKFRILKINITIYYSNGMGWMWKSSKAVETLQPFVDLFNVKNK